MFAICQKSQPETLTSFSNSNKATDKASYNTHSVTANFSDRITLSSIEEIFLRHFKHEFSAYSCNKRETEVNLIKRSVSSFVRNNVITTKTKRVFLINFSIKISPEDTAKYKKTHGREIGFFNFKIQEYLNPKGPSAKISYFSEVNIEKKFQSLGLFNIIINTYNNTLKELNVNIDYLHVKSHEEFTASLYERNGYAFTPSTVALLNDNYNGPDEYKKDSSVSFDSNENIEMYRDILPGLKIKSSIEELEKTLEQF